jgi:hypothetical protein
LARPYEALSSFRRSLAAATNASASMVCSEPLKCPNAANDVGSIKLVFRALEVDKPSNFLMARIHPPSKKSDTMTISTNQLSRAST